MGISEMTDDYFLSSLLPLIAVLMVLMLTSMLSTAQASTMPGDVQEAANGSAAYDDSPSNVESTEAEPGL